MDLQKLKYFVSVAQHLNFTKAANEYHMAQTAMSRQIANLESELGVLLFYRNNRNVELTSAGKELYWEAVSLLDRYDKAVIRVQNAAHGYTSNLKIGIGSYERSIIREMLQKFCAQYPHVEISCEQYDYRVLIDKLSHDLIDIAFGINKFTDRVENLETVTINNSPWILAVSKNHPLSTRPFVNMQDLKDQTVITMNEGSSEQIRRFTDIDALDFIHVNSLDAKMLLVESGLGVAFVPTIISDVISSNIKLLDIHPLFLPRVFLAAYMNTNHNPSLFLFLDIIRQYGIQKKECGGIKI